MAYSICKKNQQDAHIFIKGLIQLYYLRHVSNNYVFITRKSIFNTFCQRLDCTYKCMIKHRKATCTFSLMTNT